MSIIIKLCTERECVCNLFKSLSINVDTNPQSIGNCPLNVMYLWNDTGLLTQKARIPTRYLGSIVGALKCGNISAADLHWLRNRNHTTTTTTADNTHTILEKHQPEYPKNSLESANNKFFRASWHVFVQPSLRRQQQGRRIHSREPRNFFRD